MNQRNFLILFFVVCTFYSHQAAGNHYFSDDNKEIVDYEDVTTLKPSIRKNSEFLTTLRPQINIVSTEVSTVYRSPEISTRTTINDIEEGGRVEEINYSSGNTQINNFIKANKTPKCAQKCYKNAINGYKIFYKFNKA